MDVGIVIVDEDPATALEVAKAADAASVHSIWSIDYYNRSSLTRVASWAAATTSVVVGTSVTPLFARAPLALAAAARDLQVLSGGRFVLGVGSSTRRMNSDWYAVELDHPAPRVGERIELVRRLIEHEHGPFTFTGRFDRVTMSHFDRAGPAARVPIHAAAVGSHMVRAAGRVADGLVAHTVASAALLRESVQPAVRVARALRGADAGPPVLSSQVVASVATDAERARDHAALQVAFYSTPKGYDALFPDEQDERSRTQARDAFARGDIADLAEAGRQLVDERAVHGTESDVHAQLARYEDVLDLALLYPPSYGVAPDDVTRNEYALIDVAARWKDSDRT